MPIGLQDSRHTAATWLDHAGVTPKVASAFMGHKAPGRHLHPDAAPMTLRRYTHVLSGEPERARDQLDAFLVEREKEEAAPDRPPSRATGFPSAFPPTAGAAPFGFVEPRKG